MVSKRQSQNSTCSTPKRATKKKVEISSLSLIFHTTAIERAKTNLGDGKKERGVWCYLAAKLEEDTKRRKNYGNQ